MALAVALLAATGCYRTVYHHLEPPSYQPATQAPRVMPEREDSGWRSFFLYGWAPSEKVIDAAGRCGGAAQVEEIRTERSFLQGFLTVIASAVYGLNIYSPYTGEVVCVGEHRE